MLELKTPYLAVDAVIKFHNKIVVIERKFEPLGFALPGGFVEYGESCQNAIRREVEEETGLHFYIDKLVGVYSNPKRDPRQHVVSVVYSGEGFGTLLAGDDAKKVDAFEIGDLLNEFTLAFDHRQILLDYYFNVSFRTGDL
jgi:8-oxo-dGTP diphosphatase